MLSLPSPVSYQIYEGTLALPTGKAYGYFMAGNGVFKYAENRLLRALVPVTPRYADGIVGLSNLTPFVEVKRGKLSSGVLLAILRDARRQAWEQPVEAMYHVIDDGEQVNVLRPQQTATSARCTYTGGGDPDTVCDLHSHVEMRAFFSATDTRDELGFRLYAVIGRIFTKPEIRMRVGIYGDFWTVPATTLFESVPFMQEVACEAYRDR